MSTGYPTANHHWWAATRTAEHGPCILKTDKINKKGRSGISVIPTLQSPLMSLLKRRKASSFPKNKLKCNCSAVFAGDVVWMSLLKHLKEAQVRCISYIGIVARPNNMHKLSSITLVTHLRAVRARVVVWIMSTWIIQISTKDGHSS